VRTLRAHLDTRDALSDAIRKANASLEPVKVATWLVGESAGWFEAPGWAVIAHDPEGRPIVVAHVGVTETLPAGVTDYIGWMTGEVDELAGALK